MCERGDPVTLRPEPDNPYDEHAIAVDNAEGMMMGYIPANRAPYIGMQISRGEVSAIFQGRGTRGAFCRIAFDGETPTLPPVMDEGPDEAPNWWPDEIWEDE